MTTDRLSHDIERVILSEAEISTLVEGLGRRINNDYAGKKPLFITVLRGGFMFLADLIRHVDLPLGVDFMAISSYGADADDSGIVQVLKDLDELITGRDVILVEDIIDTGLTLNYLSKILMARKPASFKVCALLDRSVRRIALIDVEYKGFDLPDIFVVGYGLDFQERYRNLPFIGVLKNEILMS